MNLDDLREWRRERMQALAEKFGSNTALGRALGYRDGAFVGQMIGGHRPITEKTVAAVNELPSYTGWFDNENKMDDEQEQVAIDLENNPDYPAIKHVVFKLNAGCSGFGVEYTDEIKRPVVFSRQWYEEHGYKPAKLFAVKVANGSMEPGLYHDDMVVVNTADTNLKDGVVFAMNFEGELVIKRLVRDGGQWWLSSDNADQRRYSRKVCDENVFCLGRIVHKQSERI